MLPRTSDIRGLKCAPEKKGGARLVGESLFFFWGGGESKAYSRRNMEEHTHTHTHKFGGSPKSSRQTSMLRSKLKRSDINGSRTFHLRGRRYQVLPWRPQSTLWDLRRDSTEQVYMRKSRVQGIVPMSLPVETGHQEGLDCSFRIAGERALFFWLRSPLGFDA